MYSPTDYSQLSAEDKKKKRSAIQMEMIIIESDVRKFHSKRNVLDAEIRKIRMDTERLRIDLDNKQKEYKKVEQDIIQNEEDLKRLRKQLNLLA